MTHSLRFGRQIVLIDTGDSSYVGLALDDIDTILHKSFDLQRVVGHESDCVNTYILEHLGSNRVFASVRGKT